MQGETLKFELQCGLFSWGFQVEIFK